MQQQEKNAYTCCEQFKRIFEKKDHVFGFISTTTNDKQKSKCHQTASTRCSNTMEMLIASAGVSH